MSQVLEASLANVSQADWDTILDSAFGLEKYNRLIRTGDWRVITGMRINLPDALSLVTPKSGNLLIWLTPSMSERKACPASI